MEVRESMNLRKIHMKNRSKSITAFKMDQIAKKNQKNEKDLE